MPVEHEVYTYTSKIRKKFKKVKSVKCELHSRTELPIYLFHDYRLTISIIQNLRYHRSHNFIWGSFPCKFAIYIKSIYPAEQKYLMDSSLKKWL